MDPNDVVQRPPFDTLSKVIVFGDQYIVRFVSKNQINNNKLEKSFVVSTDINPSITNYGLSVFVDINNDLYELLNSMKKAKKEWADPGLFPFYTLNRCSDFGIIPNIVVRFTPQDCGFPSLKQYHATPGGITIANRLLVIRDIFQPNIQTNH